MGWLLLHDQGRVKRIASILPSHLIVASLMIMVLSYCGEMKTIQTGELIRNPHRREGSVTQSQLSRLYSESRSFVGDTTHRWRVSSPGNG